MKLKYKITSILFLLLNLSFGLYAQSELNDYKYVVVPEQFSCQKKPNNYRLNGLTKFLLEKQNFTVFLDSEQLPTDAANNGCLVLYTDVTEDSSMFKTKLKINFKNCKNQVVFTSQEGVSRDKEYKVAYNVALRNTIKTFETFKHNYSASAKTQPVVVNKPVKETIPDIQEAESTNIETKETVDFNSDNIDIFEAELIQGKVFSYHLKNIKGEIIYTILFYGKEDLYLVKGEEALIYKINNHWVLAEYIDDNLQIKKIHIKF